MKSLTGRTPIVYSYDSFIRSTLGNTTAFKGYPLWYARYTSVTPTSSMLPGGWQQWTMWQYTSTGTTPGIVGAGDVNRFNGTLVPRSSRSPTVARAASRHRPPRRRLSASGLGHRRGSTWAPPTDTGGSPVHRYRVSIDGGPEAITPDRFLRRRRTRARRPHFTRAGREHRRRRTRSATEHVHHRASRAASATRSLRRCRRFRCRAPAPPVRAARRHWCRCSSADRHRPGDRWREGESEVQSRASARLRRRRGHDSDRRLGDRLRRSAPPSTPPCTASTLATPGTPQGRRRRAFGCRPDERGLSSTYSVKPDRAVRSTGGTTALFGRPRRCIGRSTRADAGSTVAVDGAFSHGPLLVHGQVLTKGTLPVRF